MTLYPFINFHLIPIKFHRFFFAAKNVIYIKCYKLCVFLSLIRGLFECVGWEYIVHQRRIIFQYWTSKQNLHAAQKQQQSFAFERWIRMEERDGSLWERCLIKFWSRLAMKDVVPDLWKHVKIFEGKCYIHHNLNSYTLSDSGLKGDVWY